MESNWNAFACGVSEHLLLSTGEERPASVLMSWVDLLFMIYDSKRDYMTADNDGTRHHDRAPFAMAVFMEAGPQVNSRRNNTWVRVDSFENSGSNRWVESFPGPVRDGCKIRFGFRHVIALAEKRSREGSRITLPCPATSHPQPNFRYQSQTPYP
ncbi:hypothetical protein ACRALDRAFT_1093499 [Sodiomyces alcalophilus JCM 7366]|uniref:uncharacterized protein n=1 Tax=Sodiomyces alcalophilus JCM 7366 TaxID=591952 RepID=UPI0039B5D478